MTNPEKRLVHEFTQTVARQSLYPDTHAYMRDIIIITTIIIIIIISDQARLLADSLPLLLLLREKSKNFPTPGVI